MINQIYQEGAAEADDRKDDRRRNVFIRKIDLKLPEGEGKANIV